MLGLMLLILFEVMRLRSLVLYGSTVNHSVVWCERRVRWTVLPSSSISSREANPESSSSDGYLNVFRSLVDAISVFLNISSREIEGRSTYGLVCT